MSENEQAQLEMVDLALGKPELKWVNVADIPAGPQLPNKALEDSIDTYGITGSVVLFVHPETGKYEVAGGSRVHMAAVDLGIEQVPALVYPAQDWGFYAAVRIALNSNRSPSPIAELDAIVALLASGMSEHDIANATALHLTTVKKRLALSGLREELRTALQQNKITLSVAEAVSILNAEQQRLCCDIYLFKGKLTGKDVKEVVNATAPPSAQQAKMDIPDDWRAATRKAVTAAIQNDIPLDMLISMITAEYGQLDDPEA